MEFPVQPDNPTDAERYLMTKYALYQKGRLEDLDNIINLMSPPVDITNIANPGEFKGIKIGVIGAGLAGLSAAFELRKLGFDIAIFEANEERIGGRVYTHYFNREKSLYGEVGAMRIPVSHETVWHYIKVLGLSTRPFIQQNENAFIYLRNVRVRNDPDGRNVMRYIYPKYCLTEWERKTPWQQLVYYGLESPLLYADPSMRAELLQVKPEYNQYILYWDLMSNRKIMESLGLSPDAISLISSLSPLAGENLYNSYIDIAQANYPANLSFLYEIPGGTSRLANELYKSLTSTNPGREYSGIPISSLGRVKVRKGCPVVGIHRDFQCGGVLLTYKNHTDKKEQYEKFDYVICAIPFSTLRTVDIDPLFSPLKMQAIKEVTYINSMKSLLLCKKRFWEEGGPEEQIIGGGSYTDLPITSIWYPSDHGEYCNKRTRGVPQGMPYDSLHFTKGKSKALSDQPGVLLASYSYSLDSTRLGNLSREFRIDEIKREVEEVHGLAKGYLDSIVTMAKTVEWNSEPWQRGALCFFTPQQKRLFSYAMALPEYDNRVFMAGDHISAVHRWMQGALHSGMTAANGVAAECRRRIQ